MSRIFFLKTNRGADKVKEMAGKDNSAGLCSNVLFSPLR